MGLHDLTTYLPLHTMMETFSVVVSCMVFGIIWNTYDAYRARNIVVMGAAFLSAALLDFAHLLSYQGMPTYVTPSSPQKAIVFWLAARLVVALALLFAALASWQPWVSKFRRYGIFTAFIGFTALSYWVTLMSPELLPVFWQDQGGLTPIKQYIEYGLIGAYASAALLFYRLSQRKLEIDFECRGLFVAASIMVISEFCFTRYSAVADVCNLLGHVYKVIAYIFLYQVLYVQLVRDPYLKLERSRQEIWLEKERAEVTLQSIMDGVITTDALGNIVSVNLAAAELMACTPESVKGQPLAQVFALYDASNLQPLATPVEHCLRERKAVTKLQNAMLRSASGTAYVVELLASPILNKRGEILGVVLVFKDVTAQCRAQEELQRKEHSLREAQAMAHLGSWEWDISSDTIICSEETFRIFGLKPDSVQVNYASFLALLHPEDKPLVLQAVERALTQYQPYDVEYRICLAEGGIRYVQALGEIQRNKQGGHEQMFGTLQDITERKLAEALARRSAKEIEDLYEHAACGYHSLDKDGVIRRINQTELDWLGYRREELIDRKRFSDLLAPNSQSVFANNFPRFMKHGVTRDLEYEMRRKDGTSFFVSLSATAIYDHEGNYIASRSSITDITSRKQAEMALMEKEASLSRAQAIAHLGSWRWDVDSHSQIWSDETYRIFGFAPGSIEASYALFLSLVLPEDREKFDAQIQAIFDQDESYQYEYRIRRPDGEIRHVYSQAELYRTPEGKPLYIIGTNLDITERKQAEAELRRREVEQKRQMEKQTRILDALPANLALLDSTGFIVAVNQRWIDFAHENGLPQAQIDVGANYLQAFYSTVGQDDLRTTAQGLRQILAGKARQYVEEYPCHSPSEQRWYRMLAVPLSTSECLGAVVMHIDITESWLHKNEIEALNEQLEQRVLERTSQLEAANKELEAFSYSVSHDLRAPLRVIDGFAQILAADYATALPEDAGKYLERILYATQRMGELIDDLLKLARVSRGDLTLSSINLSEMVSAILADLQHSAPERVCHCRIAPGQFIRGDAHLIKIVLENLLANAWKFTSHQDRTEIEFGVQENAAGVAYFVRDNGVGFNQKYVHKLFGAFQRLHSAEEFEGTGIGLATVQRIIARHNGAVWAESKEGEGAVFFFRL